VAVDFQLEDLLGVPGRLLGGVGELDAARLHPAAGQHLALDHYRAADFLGDLARLVGGRAEAVLGDGNPRQLDDLACLVLVKAHQRRGTLSETPGRSSRRPDLLPRVPPVCAGRKIRPRLPVFLVLMLVSGLVALSGCGTVVDREKLQDTIQSSLEKSIHEKIKNVECPSDESIDPGATFACDVIFSDDRREVATLKIRNEEADISIVGLKPKK
jgi:hypothetical protein